MFGRRPRETAVKRGDLRAFIDEGAEIEGKFVFSGVVMLNGKISGEIDLTPQQLESLKQGKLYVQLHTAKGVPPDGSTLWGWLLK